MRARRQFLYSSFLLCNLNRARQPLLIVLCLQCGNLPRQTWVEATSSPHTSWPRLGSRSEPRKGNKGSPIFSPAIQNI